MEFLLNLAWLLLAMPAFWLWRYSRTAPHQRRSAFQCLLALGCMLVILFPVISATDDLCAMRAEMEESPTGKRSISHSGGDKSPVSKSHAQPASAVSPQDLVTIERDWYSFAESSFLAPSLPGAIRAIRAPPLSIIG